MTDLWYVATRVNSDGTETELRRIDTRNRNYNQKLQIRATAILDAKQDKLNGMHVRIYAISSHGTNPEGTINEGDLIWDSELGD